jgi:hypothetical protein
MAELPITLASQVVASKNQVSTELGGEAVILGVDEGEYFGLNEVGARVWALVQAPVLVSAICETIGNEYEVNQAECERDVLELLTDLRGKGLIDVTPGLGAP